MIANALKHLVGFVLWLGMMWLLLLLFIHVIAPLFVAFFYALGKALGLQ